MVDNSVVEIISIGEELLIGKIVNTNAQWIAKRLTDMGWRVRRITTIGDDANEIISAIREAVNRGTKVIITTGGLGPTFDDKTIEAISKATNRILKLDENVLREIEEKLKRRGRTLSEPAKKMAYIPEGSKIINNLIGTAPGIMLEYEGATIIALPGVPSEMEDMFEREVIKILGFKHKFQEKELTIYNVPEAELAPTIIELMREIPDIYIKSHPKTELGNKITLKLHIYSQKYEDNDWNKVIEKVKEKIREKHNYCEIKEI
ncbi:MAG: molybdopterin-binding protein [archaeon YNP-WB-062]|jgi:molybdenum cofactor synthesis domain-containing protein|nr:molybdopterin-binding protein [Candidatus Culexarchaeum yellowstonense]